MVSSLPPGEKAEENFCRKLQPIIGKPLTEDEKKILLLVMKRFNKIHTDYFSENDMKRMLSSDIIITEITKVGSKKSSNIKTKKNDIKITTNFRLENHKYLFFGISYKFGQARTIQSWSNIDTWETIFQKEKTPKHYIENVLKILTKITENHARNSEFYFLGSTLHLKPLEKSYKEYFKDNEEYDYEILRMRNQWSTKYPTEHTKYINRISNRIQDDKKLKYQLNKYFNKILKKDPSILHYLLFGEKEEQCLFYYRENIDTPFQTLQDFFNEMKEQLFIAGPPIDENSVLKKLTDKIEVVPNYVYPTLSASNNYTQYLVIWNNEKNSSHRTYYLSKELFENGDYIPYYEFRRKKPSPPEILNFIRLKKYYNDEFSIKFGNIRMDSKKFPELPKDISDILDSSVFSIREKVEFSIENFMLLFNMDLLNVMEQVEWENYMNDISKMYTDYNKEGQLKFLVKLFRNCLQILKERNDFNIENNTTFKHRFKKKSSTTILDIDYSKIFEEEPENTRNTKRRRSNQINQEEPIFKKKK